jgi:hypothetical protein
MTNFFSRLIVGCGLAGLIAAGSAGAADVWSQKISVPFDFKVSTATLPAGQYRVEQDFGKGFVYLVNVENGRRIQVLRDGTNGGSGHVKLSFERTADGYKLTKIN